jgi:hypothetical protein
MHGAQKMVFFWCMESVELKKWQCYTCARSERMEGNQK